MHMYVTKIVFRSLGLFFFFNVNILIIDVWSLKTICGNKKFMKFLESKLYHLILNFNFLFVSSAKHSGT